MNIIKKGQCPSIRRINAHPQYSLHLDTNIQSSLWFIFENNFYKKIYKVDHKSVIKRICLYFPSNPTVI